MLGPLLGPVTVLCRERPLLSPPVTSRRRAYLLQHLHAPSACVLFMAHTASSHAFPLRHALALVLLLIHSVSAEPQVTGFSPAMISSIDVPVFTDRSYTFRTYNTAPDFFAGTLAGAWLFRGPHYTQPDQRIAVTVTGAATVYAVTFDPSNTWGDKLKNHGWTHTAWPMDRKVWSKHFAAGLILIAVPWMMFLAPVPGSYLGPPGIALIVFPGSLAPWLPGSLAPWLPLSFLLSLLVSARTWTWT